MNFALTPGFCFVLMAAALLHCSNVIWLRRHLLGEPESRLKLSSLKIAAALIIESTKVISVKLWFLKGDLAQSAWTTG
jgi:hypothetical protein